MHELGHVHLAAEQPELLDLLRGGPVGRTGCAALRRSRGAGVLLAPVGVLIRDHPGQDAGQVPAAVGDG